jgi:membrane peptidoglycan carboxypeptidase
VIALSALGGAIVLGAVALLSVAVDSARVYTRLGGGMEDAAAVMARLPQGGSRISDRNGTLLYEYRTSDVRRYVPLSAISPWMLRATVATEDASFWTNEGINLHGLARAGIENFTPFAEQGWLRGSGGSSITQQLAKNVYIAPDERFERSIDRKLKEVVLALELTRRYSKEQILEWYLNSISYGGQYVGVEAAAQGYFGKPASELTIGEASMLAGIPQRPAAYDPATNPQAARARQQDVLDLMVRHGVATPEEVASTHAELVQAKDAPPPMHAPHFVFGPVARAIEERFGPQALAQGGLEITTTLDLGLQDQAQEILERWIAKYEGVAGGHNGALYALDARDGSVLVYIGSRAYDRDDIAGRNDNVAALNSPGSTLKPFTYLQTFMKGWSPATSVLDVPMKLKDGMTGEDFVPRDPSQQFLGVLSVGKVLGNSLNVPAVQAIQFGGVNETVALMRRMGLTSLNPGTNYYGPALTLGGVDVSLEELVYSYSVLAAGGRMRGDAPDGHAGDRALDPAVLLRVTDAHGRVLYERDHTEERAIIPESYAYIVTNTLNDPQNQCITWGACGALNLPGRPSAQKTGTSEPFENTKTLIGDTWSIGYTPQIVAGTWFGNADNSPMRNIYSTTVSWQVWREFMLAAHERLQLPPQSFVRPPTVVDRQVCAGSGKLPTEACPTGGRTTSIFAAEALQGARPIAQFDDWWQRTPIGLRLVLPPLLQQWTGTGAWVSRLGTGAVALELTPTPIAASTTTRTSTPQRPAAGSAPRVQLSTPGSGSLARGPVAVSGIASSGALTSVTVEVSTPGGGWQLVGQAGDAANGVAMTWAVWDASAVPDGAYAVRVTTRDASGATASAIAGVMVQH